jgi:hypothetical protein
MLRRQDCVDAKDNLLRRLQNAEHVAVFEIDTDQPGKAVVVHHLD